MKRTFQLLAIAFVAGGMMLCTSCKTDPQDTNTDTNGTGTGDPVLLTEAFESGIPSTWSVLDNDGDGHNWEAAATGLYGVDSSLCVMSASYINNVGALTPDNYMITPAIKIPNNGYHISWAVAAQDASYPADVYDVYVGTISDGTFTAIKSIYNETISSATFETRTVSLADYAGQTVAFAFRHHDCTDNYIMKIDNVKVSNVTK